MLSLAGYLAAAHVASAGSDRSGSSTFAGGQNTVATGSNASSASSAVGATDNGATSVTVPPGYGWAGNNAGGGVSSSHGS
jgi:hypothetical protein